MLYHIIIFSYLRPTFFNVKTSKMTKRIYLALFLALLINSATLVAQNQKYPHAITWKVLFQDYYTPLTDLSHFKNSNFKNINGAEIGYFRNLGKYINVGVPLRLSAPTLPISPTKLNITNDFLVSGDLVGQLGYFGKKSWWIVPYVTGGIGAVWETGAKKVHAAVPVGAGLNLRLAEGFYLQAQTEYRYGIAENRDNWLTSLGFATLLGKAEDDRDEDGIIDKEDACPDEKGLKELQGCPDRDGDGIADKDDACPDEKGPKETMGCPDRDGDGVADKDDKCPDVKGLKELMGCPDRDGDGVADQDDECPDVKGSVALKGCPDTDGDGIMDKDDACPNDKGTAALKGCPDTDGDGIADKDDACPREAGLSKFKGCPDTDGDGLSDKEDKCPKEAGPISNQGCPEMKKEDKEVLNFALQAVQFETGSSKLKKESYAVLDKVVEVLQKYPNYNCAIGGHTDNVGNDAMNLKLSDARANVCRDYLIKKGVAADRLTAKGYGESQPVADNKTAQGRKQNRRTEFNVSLK